MPVLTLANFWETWRLRTQAPGGLGRLARIAAVVGVLQTLPFAAGMALAAGLSDDEIVQSQFHTVSLCAGLFNAIALSLRLQPPLVIGGVQEALEESECRDFREQLDALANRVQIRTPACRVVAAADGTPVMYVWSGSLAAPTLVLGREVLTRLPPAQRDALVAGGLSQFAANVRWWMALPTLAASLLAVAVAGIYGAVMALSLGLAIRVGLNRLMSRRFSRYSDREAARHVSPRATALSLRAAYAVHEPPMPKWLGLLDAATGHYPSLAQRLAALPDAAGQDDRRAVEESRKARSDSRAACLTVILWAAVTLLSLLPIVREISPWLATGLLLAVATFPLGVFVLQLAAALLRPIRRWDASREWLAMLIACLSPLVVLACLPFLDFSRLTGSRLAIGILFVILVASGVLAVSLGMVRRMWGPSRLLQAVNEAMAKQEFTRVLELTASAGETAARDRVARYQAALAAAVVGQHARAIAELGAIREAHPRFRQASLMLAAVYLADGQPEQARELSLAVAEELKTDPEPFVLLSRACRELERYDESERAAIRALEVEPNCGTARAAAAGVALDRGEMARARAVIEEARCLAPGDPFVLLVAAQVAQATEDPGTAAIAFEQAAEAAAANPLALLKRDAAGMPSEENLSPEAVSRR
ncbi:MAG: hypothetical protein KY476_22820 [Planctomycetes bacterium]|nr:hypothetical protein [Planctomycetota bacterium]